MRKLSSSILFLLVVAGVLPPTHDVNLRHTDRSSKTFGKTLSCL
jgi:hypothetical protein